MMLVGYRNTILGVLYIVLCAYLAHVSGPENIADLGGPYGGAAIGVAMVVGLRAANKYAERKNGAS